MADKFEPKFDPIWQDDFADLRGLSRTAFILRQIYRSYRNPKTNQCNLSDLKIRIITGWNRESIQKARSQLIKKGWLIPNGYHIFTIPPFYKLSTSCTESRQPNLTEKPTTSCRENRHQLTEKPTTSCRETPQPYNTDITDTDVVRRKNDNNNEILSPVLKEDIKLLFNQQGQTAQPLLEFFYTVAKERLVKGYKEGVLRVALKRALSGNSKATIQDILSFENLASIRHEQDQAATQAENDKKLKEWQAQKCTDEQTAKGLEKLKEAVK